ncbi:hypothetical protein HDZ31DRAFT_64939 [Schizophyllum fasciatum]
MPSGFPDLTEESGAATPTRKPTTKKTRKDTILSLVEALLQDGANSDPAQAEHNFEDDHDVPTVDEHLQVRGAEEFRAFEKRVNALDKELRNFAHASRQLGSSVAILSSAFYLRERLAQILVLFHENASDLFPRKIQHNKPSPPATDAVPNRRKRRVRDAQSKINPHVARPTVKEDLDLEFFPDQFEALAVDVKKFVQSLNEFPEFMDDAVNASVEAFEGDLKASTHSVFLAFMLTPHKYWASCLREYAGQFRYPAVQRYVHDLCSEMGSHLDNITSTLCMFIEVGVPTIRFAQKHGANNLLNLSTVATFFSAVTATTMQFSYELSNDNPTAVAVNCFWFGSLVFSIAAAVNSLLGLTWKQAMYRSPGHKVPWWVSIWIKRSPLVFLVMSVACFSIGLCCFSYASLQNNVTSVLTTVLTAITNFGLAAVSAWFATERYIFLRHRGRKWLSDVLRENNQKFLNLPAVRATRKAYQTTTKPISKASRTLYLLSAKTISMLSLSETDRSDDLESATLPTHRKESTEGSNVRSARPSDVASSPSSPALDRRSASPFTPPSSPTPLLRSGNGSVAGVVGAAMQAAGIDELPLQPSKGRQLWRNALRTIRLANAGAASPSTISSPRSPQRQRTSSSTPGMAEPIKAPPSKSRVTVLVQKLRELEPTQEIAAHSALVRHLQFSPDGKYLATSSWDRTSIVFKVGDPLVPHRTLAHTQGFVGQVAWSPKGNLLLTKFSRGMKVWMAENGVCMRTIDRGRNVESITWFPDGNAFLSVETDLTDGMVGTIVTKLNIKGRILDQFHLERVKLHDVAVTPDAVRFIGVGPLLSSQDGLIPKKSRAEKRLIVYNMETNKIENQTPVLNDVRDITISRNAKHSLTALVSYENKAPPQRWKMDLVKDRDDPTQQAVIGRLSLVHTYMPKDSSTDFAGQSYFGGRNDELVLCAGKSGEINIWDAESGALLHHVRGEEIGGDLTTLGWNYAVDDPFMFAVGSHDGAVRIWTKPNPASLVVTLPPLDSPRSVLQPNIARQRSRSISPYPEITMSRTESPVSQDYESFVDAETELGPPGRSVTFSDHAYVGGGLAPPDPVVTRQ